MATAVPEVAVAADIWEEEEVVPRRCQRQMAVVADGLPGRRTGLNRLRFSSRLPREETPSAS